MKTAALMALLFLQLTAKSQSVSSSVVNSTGNSYLKGYYSIEWSVGELAIVAPMKSGDGSFVLSNGLLQPELHFFSLIPRFSDDEVKILPNPTYDKVEINIATGQQGVLSASVYNAKGNLVWSEKTGATGVPRIQKIDMISFAAGTYIVRLELDPAPGSIKKIGSYKIVKL